MIKLFLIRHAKSSWDFSNLSDFERPLNSRGEKDAPFMGKRLKKFQVRPDLIISSPAQRAKMTAEIIAKEIEYPLKDILFEQAIYEADIPDLLKVLKGMDDSNQRVMLFGHNPGFTNLVNFLSGERISNLPTCGICGINFKINSWKELTHDQGRLDFFDYPKKHS